MTGLALPPRSLDLRALAASAWRWWLSELGALLPGALVDRIGPRSSPIVVAVTPEAVVILRRSAGRDAELLGFARDALTEPGQIGAAAAAVGRLLPPGEAVSLRLPAAAALRRRVNLPLGAGRNLREILHFEVDRQSPIEPRQIHFDYRILRRDKAANKLSVELRIVKRDAVNAALSLCRSLGLAPASLAFAGDEPAFDLPGLSGAVATSAGRRRRRLLAALAGLAGLLAVALVSVEWAEARQETRDMAARLARAKAEAQAVERLGQEVDRLAARTEFLAREKAKPLAIRLVDEITRLLPDGTWLSQLDMQGSAIHIRGYSPSASALIARFDGSPLFTNARFEAPVTQAPKPGLEHFDLSFDLRSDRP
jgi:general secretion pathway protein L